MVHTCSSPWSLHAKEIQNGHQCHLVFRIFPKFTGNILLDTFFHHVKFQSNPPNSFSPISHQILQYTKFHVRKFFKFFGGKKFLVGKKIFLVRNCPKWILTQKRAKKFFFSKWPPAAILFFWLGRKSFQVILIGWSLHILNFNMVTYIVLKLFNIIGIHKTVDGGHLVWRIWPIFDRGRTFGSIFAYVEFRHIRVNIFWVRALTRSLLAAAAAVGLVKPIYPPKKFSVDIMKKNNSKQI